MMLARDLGVILIFLPHHSTQKTQPNDQDTHLETRKCMHVIQSAAREAWTNLHVRIDLEALKKGDVILIDLTDGLGDGSRRSSQLRYPQFRAANFHVGKAGDTFQWNQRNVITAALFAWKFAVTEDVVKASWKATGLVPFRPEIHEKYSAREEKAVASMQSLETRRLQFERVRLEEASPVFMTLPKPPAPAALPGGSSRRQALNVQRKENNARADDYLAQLLQSPQFLNLEGTARVRLLSRQMASYAAAMDAAEGRIPLVRGGEVEYQPPVEGQFDEDTAAAQRKKAAIGFSRNLINLTSATGFECGLVFNGHQAREQQRAASAASAANVKKHATRASAATEKKKAAAAASQQADAHLRSVSAEVEVAIDARAAAVEESGATSQAAKQAERVVKRKVREHAEAKANSDKRRKQARKATLDAKHKQQQLRVVKTARSKRQKRLRQAAPKAVAAGRKSAAVASA